jgi:hypothetical protein
MFRFLMWSTDLKLLYGSQLKDGWIFFCRDFTWVRSCDQADACDVLLNDLISELSVMQLTLSNRNMFAIEVFEFVREQIVCYPNTSIACRILFTFLVAVASAERNFSKLKLLKNYSRSTMFHEMLNGFAARWRSYWTWLILIHCHLLRIQECSVNFLW